MGTSARPTPPPLAVRECLGLCRWLPSRAGARHGGHLFACTGCGSQWRPGEPWTPIDQDGSVPSAVQAAAAVARRPAATSDRCAGGAGSPGT